jgi:hypothetical protein
MDLFRSMQLSCQSRADGILGEISLNILDSIKILWNAWILAASNYTTCIAPLFSSHVG